MPFFNCKFELKLKWTKYCVLAAAGIGNTNDNPNKNICTIKDTKICSCCHFISKKKKKIKNYQNFLARDLKDQYIGMSIKQIKENKIRQTSIEMFSNETL